MQAIDIYALVGAVSHGVLALLFWLVTTVLNLFVAPLSLNSVGVGSQLGRGASWRASRT